MAHGTFDHLPTGPLRVLASVSNFATRTAMQPHGTSCARYKAMPRSVLVSYMHLIKVRNSELGAASEAEAVIEDLIASPPRLANMRTKKPVRKKQRATTNSESKVASTAHENATLWLSSEIVEAISGHDHVFKNMSKKAYANCASRCSENRRSKY